MDRAFTLFFCYEHVLCHALLKIAQTKANVLPVIRDRIAGISHNNLGQHNFNIPLKNELVWLYLVYSNHIVVSNYITLI